MEFIFSQVCGIIASVAAIVSMQLKSIKGVLTCQLVCNGIGAFSYILLGGLSGCGIYLVALAQAIVYFFFRYKNKKAPIIVAVIFVILYIVCSVSTYKTPTDIISALAALTCAFALVCEKPSIYRIFMVANGSIWFIYDINVGAYAMIISHIATAISASVGIIRLDLKDKIKLRKNKQN